MTPKLFYPEGWRSDGTLAGSVDADTLAGSNDADTFLQQLEDQLSDPKETL